MKTKVVFFALLAAAMSTPPLFAQDRESKEKPSKAESAPTSQERMANLIALGPGVHNVKKDKDGRIVSCIIVGQSRISTVLGKSKGMEVARDKANLGCSAEFVKWLKEEVKIYQSSEDETILLLTGEEGGEDDAVRESGKAVEKTSKKIESISQGLVRGLQLLHKEVDGSGKNYSVVKGWKAETSDATKAIAEDAKDGTANSSQEKGKKGKGTKADTSKKNKEIDDEVVTSEDADDFFKDPK